MLNDGTPDAGAGLHVAMLDDSPTFLMRVEALLSDRGFLVATTTRWQELALLLRSTPDLVLLDMNLGAPPVSGLDVGRMLRRFYDTPILFLSSEPEVELRAATEAVRNSSYLHKSCDLSARLPAAVLALAGKRAGAGGCRG